MTEYIKQWIADQSREIGTVRAFLGHEKIDEKRQLGAMTALIRAVEVMEGFAEFSDDYAFYKRHNRWVPAEKIDDIEFITTSNSLSTSQLLEKYLEYLSSINKQK